MCCSDLLASSLKTLLCAPIIRGMARDSVIQKTIIKKDVGGGGAEKRNWKGMLIALVVILIVCGFVILAVVLSAEDETHFNYVKLDDITTRSWLKALSTDARWQVDDFIWMDDLNNICMWPKEMDQPKGPILIISNTTIKDKAVEDYDISADRKFALFIYDKTSRFSYSYHASYMVHNLANRSSERFMHNDTDAIQFAQFGPTGNHLMYVSNGDLYYIPDMNHLNTRVSVTTTARNNDKVSNGIADWLYEEEIFKSSRAHWWSPDGRYLAFAQFNDTDVPESYITTYTRSDSDKIELLKFPEQQMYSCPKAGSRQPEVTVKVFDTMTSSTMELSAPTKTHRINLLHSVTWTRDSTRLLLKWSNRTQNEAALLVCDIPVDAGHHVVCEDNYTADSALERHAWIPHLNEDAISLSDRNKFFCIHPQHNGGRGYYRHIRFIDVSQDIDKWYYLTDGAWEVAKILHFDEKSGFLFYLSNEVEAKSRHLFRMKVNLTEVGRKPERTCLTCDNNNSNLHNCTYFDAQFPATVNRVFVRCLGPALPRSFIVTISPKTQTFDFDTEKQKWRPIAYFSTDEEERLKPEKALFEYQYGVVERKIRNEKTYDINYQLVLPVSSVGKIGVVFEIGEIGEQHVDYQYKLGFAEYLASHSNIMVVRFDGCGSGMRGERLLHSIIDDPGSKVLDDVTNVLKHIKKNMTYTITSVGIMGKNFGAHVAVLAAQIEEFSCAIAMSPIVDWEAHTSVPSERLLGTPLRNSRNYQQSNLLYRMGDVGEDKLLVFHGLKDRVVHHQQTIALHEASLLERTEGGESSNQIIVHFYANQNHAFSRKDEQADMYRKAYKFIHKCLNDKPKV